MKYAVLLALMMAGCAHRPVVSKPGVMHYTGCKEVSVNVRTNEVTVICPLEGKSK